MKFLYTAIFILYSMAVFGQEKTPDAAPDSLDLSNLSISELAKMKSRYKATEMEKTINLAIEAASRKPLPLRKSPSIISVITDEEIEKSGAKDLMDVLQLIPGLEFSGDVESVVALSFRGLWTNEGSVSLQIDGQEMNEIAYASIQFGNHYQIEQIKKIEIIRGPGSALYGGCAEYAVINIVTKKGEDLKGLYATAAAGQTAETYTRQKVGIMAGNKVNDLSYSVSGMLSRGQRSNFNYTDVYGSSYSMIGSSDINDAYLNIAVKYKGLSLQLLYDNYTTINRDNLLAIMSRPYPLDFRNCLGRIKYEKQVSKKQQLTARLDYKFSEPWSFTGQPDPIDSEYTSYKLKATTVKANVSTLWDPTYWLNVNCGIEGYIDHGQLTMDQVFRNDSIDHVTYVNYAPFAQLLFKSRMANVTLGARYDVSTAFGSAFNPRIGITKRVGIFNFKLLYASSFRAPAIEAIEYAIDNIRLKPERSNTLEFEGSIMVHKHSYLAVNIFDINTTDAMRYFVKTDSVITGYPDGYRNSDKRIGSQGIEAEYKYKSSLGFLHLVYSFYTIQNKDADDANAVPGHSSATLGTAQHKFTVLASINLSSKIYLSPSVNFIGKRYAYTSVDTNDVGILSTLKPQTQVNLYLGSNNLIKNCSLGIGVSNITDEHILYPQAYNSLHAPTPGFGREYYFMLSYRLPFKQQQ